MANANGWGDGASNNNIGWGKGADNAIGWGSVYSVSAAGLTDIVGTPAVDPDAQAFFTASGLTGATNLNAINQLVVDLKGYGIWTKMKAIYPFVGGTAALHKWNLKDPQDTNAAFRLVFNGGWTHSSTGATPNGTNGYANPFLNPNIILTLLNTHLSFYSRTSLIGNNQRDIAAFMGGGSVPSFSIGTNTGVLLSDHYWYTTNRMSRSIPNAQGLMLTCRTDNITHKAYRNGVQLGATDTASNAGNTMPNANLFIGAANSDSGAIAYSTKEYAFATIGDGLTDTEAANFYTAVQAYNTSLARQV